MRIHSLSVVVEKSTHGLTNLGTGHDKLDDTWGMPTTLPPGEYPIPMVMERSYPHAIMVNAKGRRFTNEAMTFSYVAAMHAAGHLTES